MNHQDTFDDLCILLEQHLGRGIDDVATEIMAFLDITSEVILSERDPPPGLRRWLASHGLVLVAAAEPTPTHVMDLIDEDDDVVEAEVSTQERAGGSSPLLGVGDYVQYRTAPMGPNNMSQLGSGTVVGVHTESIEVEFSPNGGRIVLFLEADTIQVIRSSRDEDAGSEQLL